MGKWRGRRGVLITFEGVEGSGKSTQCARLAKLLREAGYRVLETREPGGTPLAESIRGLFLRSRSDLSPAEPMTAECEALLILACRIQHVVRVIEPALHEGMIVLCDRFLDSTLAYQGYGRGLDMKTLRSLNQFATGGLTPALTLLFDLPVRTGLARRRQHGRHQNRLDLESYRFHEKVRKGFLYLADKNPKRIKILNGRKDPEIIAGQVLSIVQDFLKRRTQRWPSL